MPLEKIKDGSFLPDFTNSLEGVQIPQLKTGDSAFPFEKWLMKPYTNAVLTPSQRYFNYRLSRARLVIEGACGQLKGRWRMLMRKSESAIQKSRTSHLNVWYCITFVLRWVTLSQESWI